MILLKIVLLLLYIVFLLAVYRVADYLAWSDAAGVTTLVDPIDLSLRQLRWLLHARGISYHGAIEKKDLSDFVSSSGVVSKDEIKAAKNLESLDTYDAVTFSSKAELEAAIDNPEDIWVVQVVADEESRIMSKDNWKKFRKRTDAVGVRTGQLFCQDSPSVCQHLSIFTSQLMISSHFKKKRKGIHERHFFTRNTDDAGAFSWLSATLLGSTTEIKSLEELGRFWLNAKSQPAVQVIYVSTMNRVPLVFATLEAKFRGRYRFGKYSLKKDTDLIAMKRMLNLKSNLPETFVCISTAQKAYIYAHGKNNANFLHFNDLYLFLHVFNPDVNLLFTWSIYFCNLLASLSFFIWPGRLVSRIVNTVKSFFFYNAILLLSWVFYSTYKPNHFLNLLDFILVYIRAFSVTHTASFMRQCFHFYMFRPSLVCIGFVVFFSLMMMLLRKLNVVETSEDSDSLADILLANENRSNGYNDISRRWVERLATPALWLQPLVPSDYIENLPVWKYTGECATGSDDSDSSGGTRTSSVSPSREWTSHHWRDEPRGRSCFSSRESASKRLKKGLLWSLKSCLRGRSPRCNRIAAPPERMREEQSCAVCLENYKTHSSVCGLPCGHVFHHDCILQWLHSDKHCCPVCRWPAYQLK